MSLDFSPLDSASRLLVEATLRVAPGSGGRFQPTGFPDLGPALYKGVRSPANAKNGNCATETVDMLLIESVQSMANRLEEVCLQGEDYNADCQGIPYVRVLDGHRDNAFLTSSVREPHRLGSPYVLGKKPAWTDYKKEFERSLNADKNRPVHIWRMVPEIFNRDPGCVLHGVFLDDIDGRIRLPRLVSGYIEAASPNQANSGGVHRGEVTAKDNIPYPRQEFTSSSITASFIFHMSTLKGYCLDQPKNRFLQAWALYKIDRFLHQYLRLRTACEFDVADLRVTLDGTSTDIGGGDGKWPSSSDIVTAFTGARDTCFPRHTVGDEWAQRRVTVVTHAVDIEGGAALGDASADTLDLTGFDGRAEVKEVTRKRQKGTVLELTGDWHDEEERQKLLDQNPETKVTADGEEVKNPAHEVVKKALQNWDAAWQKLRKKSEESGDEE